MNGKGRSGRSSKGPGALRDGRSVVDRGVEAADHVAEHTRRDDEDGAAVAAVGGVADAVGRPLREERRLVDVGGDAAPPEVLAEDAVSHEDDVVAVGVFLGRGAAATGAAAVVAHTDERAFMERAECEHTFNPHCPSPGARTPTGPAFPAPASFAASYSRLRSVSTRRCSDAVAAPRGRTPAEPANDAGRRPPDGEAAY